MNKEVGLYQGLLACESLPEISSVRPFRKYYFSLIVSVTLFLFFCELKAKFNAINLC